MSKRPSSSEGHHEHKRQRQTSSYSVQEALAELSKHAEGIADCLQTLKEHQEALRSIDSQNPEVAHIENQISQLRSTLVPALQSSTPNQNYGAVEARSSVSFLHTSALERNADLHSRHKFPVYQYQN